MYVFWALNYHYYYFKKQNKQKTFWGTLVEILSGSCRFLWFGCDISSKTRHVAHWRKTKEGNSKATPKGVLSERKPCITYLQFNELDSDNLACSHWCETGIIMHSAFFSFVIFGEASALSGGCCTSHNHSNYSGTHLQRPPYNQARKVKGSIYLKLWTGRFQEVLSEKRWSSVSSSSTS